MKHPRSGTLITAFALLAALLSGCSDDGVQPQPPEPSVSSVSVNPPSATVVGGDTTQLTATVRDQNGNEMLDQEVLWASSDDNVAEASPSGAVITFAAGNVSITATAAGVTGSAALTVVCPEPREVTQNLIGEVTWFSRAQGCTDYVVSGVRRIEGSLTVGPNTWVVFRASSALHTLGSSDYVQISGEAGRPVRFFGESGEAGFWRGIGIRNHDARNRIEYLEIDGAGIGQLGINTSSMTNTAIGVGGGMRVGISNTTIRNSGGDGLKATADGTILTGFANNRFESIAGSPVAVLTTGLQYLDSETVYMADDAPHGEPYVRVTRDTRFVSSDQTWPNTGIPIRYMTNGRQVVSAHLTITPGATLEFAAAGGGLMIRPEGALTADGSDGRITFRGATPQQGSWQGLFFDSANDNRLVNVVVSDGGAPTPGIGGEDSNVRLLQRSRLQLLNSSISNSLGCGVFIGREVSFDDSGTEYASNARPDICVPD